MNSDFDAHDDGMTDLMERRWFAMNSAADRLRGECDALARVFEMAESAWLGACSRLKHLEAMRDVLGDELARRQVDAPRLGADHAGLAARDETDMPRLMHG